MDARRRAVTQGLVAASVIGPVAAARAQAWPGKPLRIVHGYDNGSNPDTVARAIGPALTERLGQPVVVEPKPGAGGRIATAFVAKAEPDGYSFMMLTAGDGVNAATEANLPYDLLKDYAFVTTVVEFPFFLMVNAESPIRTLEDLLQEARKAPNKLSFATPGVRTTQHLAGELLKATAGVELLHVPFKGNAFVDLLGGRVDSIIAAPSVSVGQIRSGKVRALAVTSRARVAAFPDVPTIGERYPGFEVTSWLGLAAPAGTPPAILERLGAEVRQALARDDVKARLAGLGSDPAPSTGEQFRARVENDIRKWKGLAGKAKLDG
jgi:tripartite-type tricarboxylate transporter receptor subunit TctC